MALTPCSRCKKGNWLTVYENQCFIARNSTAETLLLGDSTVKGLNRYKVLISASAEIAQEMFFGELFTCQKCLI